MKLKVAAFTAMALALVTGVDSHAQPRELTFTLNCEWQRSGTAPIGSPRLTVTKTAFKTPSGKWDAKYAIVAYPLSPSAKPIVVDLTSAGSGDEDYNEYEVANPHPAYPVSGAYIQNRFKWATIVDKEGSASYRCQ